MLRGVISQTLLQPIPVPVLEKRFGSQKNLPAISSPLESEIRSGLIRLARSHGLDGHKSALTKFSELLLLNGVISTQQMGSALDLVGQLFNDKGTSCIASKALARLTLRA